MANKITNYLLFCESFGVPKYIPIFIIRTHFKNGVYCENCEHKTFVPDFLIKIAEEL